MVITCVIGVMGVRGDRLVASRAEAEVGGWRAAAGVRVTEVGCLGQGSWGPSDDGGEWRGVCGCSSRDSGGC